MNPAPTLRTKPHYEILDGLRGIAALTVVLFHTFEAYADDNRFKQHLNHGYLAVDFFFLLSGFVIAYAYDDRWSSKPSQPRMTLRSFFTRRLIRLQPMVILGSLIGAALFYPQAAPIFPLIAATPAWKTLLVMLLGCTLIPLPVSLDIRGWQEMHPLNGPAWSLFFEYLANIAYALVLRKLANRTLAVLTLLAAALLIHLTVFGPRGDVIGGWAIDRTQLHIGFTRLLYPFLAGLLLLRLNLRLPPRLHLSQALPICSLALVALLVCPRLGGPQHLWLNGLYETFTIALLFPLIVAVGASQTVLTPRTLHACRLLGDISYPLYITHYPLIYLYTAWVTHYRIPPARGAVVGALLFLTAITIAYTALKLYDQPFRAYLTRRLLPRST